MPRKPIVLFVDDEPTTRRIYEYRFTAMGLPHYIAESAEAAVRILEEKPVDIVITDLLMPTYDGTDLVVCMREAELTRSIPIILFTTGGNEAKIAQAMKAGATEVLPKQTTPPDKLIARIYALTSDALAREQPRP